MTSLPLTLSTLPRSVSRCHDDDDGGDAAVKVCSTYTHLLLSSADRCRAEMFRGHCRPLEATPALPRCCLSVNPHFWLAGSMSQV